MDGFGRVVWCGFVRFFGCFPLETFVFHDIAIDSDGMSLVSLGFNKSKPIREVEQVHLDGKPNRGAFLWFERVRLDLTGCSTRFEISFEGFLLFFSPLPADRPPKEIGLVRIDETGWQRVRVDGPRDLAPNAFGPLRIDAGVVFDVTNAASSRSTRSAAAAAPRRLAA